MEIRIRLPVLQGISGAYLGIGAIPYKWARNIEKTKYLEELAIRLATAT